MSMTSKECETGMMSKACVTLSKEDAAFMAALSEEMQSQPTDGNRAPRFWVVMETVLEYGFDKDCSDGWGVFESSSDGLQVGRLDDLDAVKETICHPYNYAIGTKEDYEECCDAQEVVAKANELYGEDVFSVLYYRKRNVARENTFFLTKRACQEHIRKYGHNYSNPFPYVMTAERSPEFERLLNIIERTTWKH